MIGTKLKYVYIQDNLMIINNVKIIIRNLKKEKKNLRKKILIKKLEKKSKFYSNLKKIKS
jgi:hypothetical protein